MKDLASFVKATQVFGPAVLAADATAVIVDLQGYHSAVILMSVGVGGITFDTSNYLEISAAHSDDNSTYTDVAVADLMGVDAPTALVEAQGAGDTVLKSFKAAHAAAAIYKVGYIGGKRYLRIDVEFTGTHGTGTPVSIVVLRGDAELQPVD